MDVNPQTDPALPSGARAGPVAGGAGALSAADKPGHSDGAFGFASFLLKVVLAFVILRSFVIAPFSIPSDSMLPNLWQGDYVIASKWPYGYSRYSLPFNAPLIPGRLFARPPERGDIVFFKHPVDAADYVKRVVAVPGDTIAMRDGRIVLNGAVIEQQRIGEFAIPLSAISDCPSAQWDSVGATGEIQCQMERLRETWPGDRQSDVLNITAIPQDNFAEIEVPEGRVFVLGDHRDKSSDSRFPAQADLGVGLVPLTNLVGRAEFIIWSTDGSAQWAKPWTWFTAARWDRIGTGL